MAQSDISQYPASAVGAVVDHGDWGPPSIGRGGQPPDESVAVRREQDQQRMLQAIRSVGSAAVRPAAPEVAASTGAMVRINAVLASWRAKERELSALPESSPDRPRLRALVEGLRVTYQRLFAERRDDTSGP